MKANDYHGNKVEWKNGQNVTHVADDGQEYHGTIQGVTADGLVKIEFTNNEEGWERPQTCYHVAIITTNEQLDRYRYPLLGECPDSKARFKSLRGAKQAARAFWKREAGDESCRLVILGPDVDGFYYSGLWQLFIAEAQPVS